MGNQFKENKGRGIDSRDVRKESTKGRQTKSSIDKDKTQGEKGNDSEDFEHSQSGDEGSGGDEEPKQKRKRSETISANTFLRDLKHRIGSKEQSEPKNKVRNEEREEDFVERLSDQILKRVMDKFEAKMIERFGDLFLSKQVFQQFLPNLITKKDYEIMEKKIRDIKVEIENLGQKEVGNLFVLFIFLKSHHRRKPKEFFEESMVVSGMLTTKKRTEKLCSSLQTNMG
eukprot:TRINITY_DN8747_c0_g1_i1.p1 TRINITY_DN8747_c0_g1~~TRINITY_DN8747_c0_g1_i1.p1  ORF type:complete len:228 (-),score=57.09 TRINITY_DN8747_c0_g1_i1:385-1068(-)